MSVSTLKRIAVILAFILSISTAGSLILSIIFHVENSWLWMALASLLVAPLLYMKVFQLHYLKWEESYYVGVEEIDYDHKKLVGLINQVVSASDDPVRRKMVPKILDRFIDYTKYHLSQEEKLMEEYDYPNRAWHADQNVKFINKIDRFYSKSTKERNMKSEEVFEFLRGWLLMHIGYTDKDFGAFVTAKRTNQDIPN